MIIELTKENLQKCGFDEEQIIKLIEWDKYDVFFLKDTCYYATNIENKIYTEMDGYRKKYFESGNIAFPIDCPDLIPQYFDLFLNSFLEIQKELLKAMFVEADQKEIFINKQMLAVKNEIDRNKVKLLKYPQLDIYHKIESIYNSYLRLLENKINEQPQQTKNNKSDAVEKILFDFIINVDKKNDFLIELKNDFSTEKGKTIKAIINILIENKMLLIPDRQFATFYKLLKANFNRNIGSYTSINDAEKSIPFDSKFLEPIKTKINPLIIKYKSME